MITSKEAFYIKIYTKKCDPGNTDGEPLTHGEAKLEVAYRVHML